MLRRKRKGTFKATSFFLTASDISASHLISLLVCRLFPSQGLGFGSGYIILERQYGPSLTEEKLQKSQNGSNSRKKQDPGDVKIFLDGQIHNKSRALILFLLI